MKTPHKAKYRQCIICCKQIKTVGVSRVVIEKIFYEIITVLSGEGFCKR